MDKLIQDLWKMYTSSKKIPKVIVYLEARGKKKFPSLSLKRWVLKKELKLLENFLINGLFGLDLELGKGLGT